MAEKIDAVCREITRHGHDPVAMETHTRSACVVVLLVLRPTMSVSRKRSVTCTL